MFWYGGHMGWWGYTLMSISMVVFWGLVIAGIVVLVRYITRGGQRRGSEPAQSSFGERPAAEQVLAERFARGEIDEDEYRRRVETLRAHLRPPASPRQRDTTT